MEKNRPLMDIGSFGVKILLKLILVMVAQLCERTRNYSIVHFKWLNVMMCELYFNKVIFKMKKRKTYQ